MGMYQIVIGVGTIVFVSLIWIMLMSATNTLHDIFVNITPSEVHGVKVLSDVFKQYDLASNIMYVSLFFIGVVVIAWMVKESVREQENVP